MTADAPATFTSRRTRLPVLILTAKMQRDAFRIDRDRAALRRDMREVRRIEDEARKATMQHLRKVMAK
jgi:hypothetical protein